MGGTGTSATVQSDAGLAATTSLSWLHAATIFLSSLLLFLVQPIIAKELLPWFGGSAGVWTTCLFFFQFVLLCGYAYAHALIRWIPPRRQGLIHAALLLISLLLLPILPSAHWKELVAGEPLPALLALLSLTVGLPYFLLSATSPLLQAWHARLVRRPYRLFALSNLASLLGLLAYPLMLEPQFALRSQASIWSIGFAAFVCACTAAALASTRTAPAAPSPLVAGPAAEGRPNASALASWAALASLGSLLLVAVTGHITVNVAAMPLLWVVPLAVYLVTFVIAFEPRRPLPLPLLAAGAVLAAAVMMWFRGDDDLDGNLRLALPAFLGGLFLACLFCHCRLAALKPPPQHLTAFYLMVALGGALGSLAGSVLAPVVLPGNFELPIALVALAAAVTWQAWPRSRVLIAAGAVAAGALALTGAGQIRDEIRGARLLARNFYSSLRVSDEDIDTPEDSRRTLVHGTIEHGEEYLDPAKRAEPLSYYGPSSGIGLAIARQRAIRRAPLSIGIIGLGAGTLAAYGEPGGRVKFYEINPEVLTVAKSQFFYLAGAKASVDVTLGDARISLEREPPQGFDVLAIDAFSGDAIPVHLLTREALQVYSRHLRAGGVVAFHVTNTYVDLAPVVKALADATGWEARLVADRPEDEETALSDSDWVIMARDPAWWGDGDLARRVQPIAPVPGAAAWTDDFSNLLSVLKWSPD